MSMQIYVNVSIYQYINANICQCINAIIYQYNTTHKLNYNIEILFSSQRLNMERRIHDAYVGYIVVGAQVELILKFLTSMFGRNNYDVYARQIIEYWKKDQMYNVSMDNHSGLSDILLNTISCLCETFSCHVNISIGAIDMLMTDLNECVRRASDMRTQIQRKLFCPSISPTGQITYGEFTMNVQLDRLAVLQNGHQLSCGEDVSSGDQQSHTYPDYSFVDAVTLAALKYSAMTAGKKQWGFHPDVYKLLSEAGVSVETFSTPFTSRLVMYVNKDNNANNTNNDKHAKPNRYCGAFESDKALGSIGHHTDYDPSVTNDVVLVYPPLNTEVVNRAVSQCCIDILNSACKPMCPTFIVVVARNPTAHYFKTLLSNKFMVYNRNVDKETCVLYDLTGVTHDSILNPYDMNIFVLSRDQQSQTCSRIIDVIKAI